MFISTDYIPNNNPENYNWNEIQFNTGQEDSQTWTSSGDINLDNYCGQKIYIAFQYLSSGTSAGQCRNWEIDNFNVIATQNSTTNAENISNNLFNLFPNPLYNNTLYLNTSNINDKVNIKIIDLYGRIKFYKIFNESSSSTIKLNPNLKSGIYFVIIQQGQNKQVFKLIKL